MIPYLQIRQQALEAAQKKSFFSLALFSTFRVFKKICPKCTLQPTPRYVMPLQGTINQVNQ
jgi:hypothetical protein